MQKIAGIRIAPSDAEMVFRSIDTDQRGAIDAGQLVAAIDAHATKNLLQPSVFSDIDGTNGSNDKASGVPENTFYNGGLTQHASPGARAAADAAIDRSNGGAAGLV